MRELRRGGGITLLLWIMTCVLLILWILGLVLGWGGWVWIFFVIGLAGLVTNILALTGRRRRVR